VKGERCERCRFWERFPDSLQDTASQDGPEDAAGHCHRFPPVLDLVQVENSDDPITEPDSPYAWNWPVTTAASWCGEFQTRKES